MTDLRTALEEAHKELLEAAAEALAIARGEAPRDSYRIHLPKEIDTRLKGSNYEVVASDGTKICKVHNDEGRGSKVGKAAVNS